MKRKLIIIVFIFTIFLLFLFPHNRTAYSGRYLCKSNTNDTLILNPNSTIIMYHTFGKSSVEASGKYCVNNNHIALQYTDKNSSIFENYISSGDVYGSEIIFSSSDKNSKVEFEK